MNIEQKVNESSLKVGDKFETVYPFKRIEIPYRDVFGRDLLDVLWFGGCHRTTEHQDSGNDYGYEETWYTADAEGKRILEVLAVVEMPRKFQRRIIYQCTMIPPEGKARKISATHCVTESRFKKMASGYFTDYELN